MAEVEVAWEQPGRVRRYASHLLRNDAAFAAIVIVGVPNLLFLLISPWFLVRRLVGPLLYLGAAVAALVLPRPLAPIAFLAAAAADAFFIVCFMFGMPPAMSLASLRYFSDVDIAASYLYLGGIAYFVGVAIVLTVVFIKRRQQLRCASLLPALLFAAALCGFEYKVNGFPPVAHPEFESALSKNGIDAQTVVAGGRNLLVVMVEGMGAYARPEEREILAGRLSEAAQGRYRLSAGTSNYHGSTTGATSRELCGQWATFDHYLAREKHDCLPGQLAAAGYRTAAYHASHGELFSRPVWYPRIGFRELNFREQIERDRPGAIHGLCGSVFPGLCDRDVGDIVHRDLLAQPEERKFFYWLTLNSHLPYAPVANGPLRCREPGAVIAAAVPCELTEIWIDVFDKVAEIATDPEMPPLDILVVGDHNTPMWSRDAFGHFVKDKVDWYFMEDVRQQSAVSRSSPAAASG